MGILKFRYKSTTMLLKNFDYTLDLIIDKEDDELCKEYIEPQMYFEALKQKKHQLMMNALICTILPLVVKKK